MSLLSEEDSVVEAMPLPLSTPAPHPTDPFLNPRRSTTAEPAFPPPSSHSVSPAVVSLPDNTLPSSPRAPACAIVNSAKKSEKPATVAATSNTTASFHTPVGVSHSGAKRQRPPASSTASGAGSAQQKAPASRSAQRPNAHAATAAAPPMDASLSDNDNDTDCATAETLGTATARGDALHDAGGGSDDDGGDGDAEEKALLEAAGAILRPNAATGSATGGTAPHPWLVTDAFHVSLWYVLRYAGAALSAADLWACRAVLLLTAARQPGGEERANASQPEEEARVEAAVDDADGVCGSLDGPEASMAEAAPLNPGAWTWTGTEESELLLRLVMRKPHAFTGRHLELRYGEWLHVEPTLAALERQRFLWWAAGDASDAGVDAQEGSAAGMSSAAMVEHYDGARVARLVLQGSEPATAELSSVLQAVRGTELRLFLTALRHGSKLHGSRDASASDTPARAASAGAPTPRATADASERRESAAPVAGDEAKVEGHRGDTSEATYRHMPLGDNSVYDVIPGRKRDMMRYFLERRYSLWAPTNTADPTLHPSAKAASSLTDRGMASTAQRGPQARRGTRSSQRPSLEASSTSGAAPPLVCRCFREPGEEARLVAHFWDTHVGPVYAPHAGLKSHLVWTTEIFHVLTANGGAGAVGQQGLKPLAATMSVAAPPTLLMVRPQLLLLLQSLRSARVQPPPQQPPSLEALPAEQTPQKQGLVTSRQLTTDTQHFANSVPYALLPRWFSAPAKTTSSARRPTGSLEDSRSCAAETGAEALGEEVIATTRSFHTLDVDETGSGVPGGLSVTPPPVQLFGTTTTVLLEYRTALHTHRALYDVTEGAVSAAQRYRGRSEAFVSQMCTRVLAAVRAGVAAVKRHPLRPATPAQASEAARFIAPLATPLSTAPPSLNAMLYRWGNHVEHLLAFAPLFRWFACLELLFPLLQSARRYVEANDCLRFLLYEPVFMLHHIPDHTEETGAAAAISPITYAFRYKTHRRGEWLSRLAQNLTHLKRFPEALALLEEAQAGYHEFAGHVADGAAVTCLTADAADEAATALCRVLTNAGFEEGKLPMKVQRRGRLLRVLWPSCADTASLGPSLAVYHAAWEYVRDRYCRRHDRLLLEKSLAMLHRRVRQWTPLAAHRQLATRQLAEVAVWRVNGVRDAMDYMLWREPSGVRAAVAGAIAPPGNRRPALPVELFVLEHFLRKWNQPDAEQQRVKGARKRLREGEEGHSDGPVRSHALAGPWYGAHCEGQWIRCLAHALLWDCYWAYPTTLTPCERPADEVHHVDHQLLWLSAFQDGPLDVTTPVNFVLRRRALLARRIAELERCSREEVVRWVAAHIKGDDADASQRAHTSTKDASPRSSVDREEEEKGKTCDASPTCRERNGDAAMCHDLVDIPVEGEEDSVLLASAPQSQSISVLPLAQSKVAEAGEGSVLAAPLSAVPEAWKVSVGSLPLLNILATIPLAPLWRLLRCLYLSPVTEGVPLRFSGFPDLVLWKRSPGAEDAASLPHGGPGYNAPSSFCLMEVKSPSDTLSTKQIAVNDMLHRCGFQVCVLRVDAVHDTGEPVSNKKIR